MGPFRPGRDHTAATEIFLECAGGLLVSDGDRRLGEHPGEATGASSGDSLRGAVRLGCLDRGPAMVAAVRAGAHFARHRSRCADGNSLIRTVLPIDGSV